MSKKDGFLLLNGSKDLHNFLHECRGKQGPLFEQDCFSEKSLNPGLQGIKYQRMVFWGLFSKMVLRWVHYCLLVFSEILHEVRNCSSKEEDMARTLKKKSLKIQTQKKILRKPQICLIYLHLSYIFELFKDLLSKLFQTENV